MAQMIPDRPPNAHQGGGHAEHILWKRLKNDLSNEFHVYHSLPYLSADASQGEIDFLILHRKRGMLVLECKGSGVYRDEDGDWYRRSDEGLQRLSKSPSEQATGHIEDIVESLREPAEEIVDRPFGKFPLLYGWALGFPKTDITWEHPPPELEDEVVVDSSNLDDLESAVCRAFNFYEQKFDGQTPTLSEKVFDQFRYGVLQRPRSLESNLSAQIKLERQQLLELSKQQTAILECFMANDRIRVHGGAGTGKTVLARHAAELEAKKGEDVLLTCFNKALAGHLEDTTQTDSLPGSIQVSHFHELCLDARRRLGQSIDFPGEDASQSERDNFWRNDFPMSLLQSLEEGDINGWDTIIVDEGQDFVSTWWEVLETGLKDGESGKLAIFYDESQSIFDRETEVPDYPNFRLKHNFRNTKEIEKRVKQLGGPEFMEPHQSCPDGQPPSVTQQPGPTKTRRLVGQQLDTLIESEGLEPGQIVILSPHSPENSSLAGADELHGHSIVKEPDNWSTDGDAVLHTTVSAFKGLESDVIIFIDIDPDDERCKVSDRYVAASRARFRLYVFENGHWLDISK